MKFGLYCIGLIIVLVVTGLLFVWLARNQPSEKMRRGCWTSILTALVILVLVFSFVIVVSATSYDGKCEMGIGSYAYEACPFEQYFIKKFFLTSVVVTAVGLALLSRRVFYRSEVSWSGPERNSVTNYSNDPSKNKLHPKYLHTTKFSVLNTLPYVLD